jgi:hypothetical protein
MDEALLIIEKYKPLLDLFQNIILAVGVVSIFIALRAYKASSANNSAQIFLTLRKYYLDIHDNLYDNIPSLDCNIESQTLESFEKLNPEQIKSIERYWINSFNEWYIMNKVFTEEGGLKIWNDFYMPAFASSLSIPFIRIQLQRMFKSNYSFGIYKPEFKNTITQIAINLKDRKFTLKVESSALRGIDDFIKNLNQ